MDNIKKVAKQLKNIKITPDNDSFELFEEYAQAKQRKGKHWLVWVSTVAAVMFSFLIFRGISEYSPISDFCIDESCLCDKSFGELQQRGYVFNEVSIKNDCVDNCSSCEAGKWYTANRLKGVVLQKAINDDEILRIRLTKDYDGKLPDGRHIKLQELQLKDLIDISQTWYAEDCLGYTSLSQGNYRILVKTKRPAMSGFTNINDNRFADMPVEAIEIFNICLNN